LNSNSICRSRRGLRWFSERGCVRSTSRSALERPKRPGRFGTAAAGPADTAALHLVAAFPRGAVAQSRIQRGAGKGGPIRRPAECNSAIRQIENQLCSARKTPAAFCLSLLAKNERGESWREGKFDKMCLLSPALSSFLRRRGREHAVTRSKQIFCRTQMIENLRYSIALDVGAATSTSRQR